MKDSAIFIVIHFFTLFFLCKNIKQNYPGCIPDIQQRIQASRESYAHRNFLQIGSFITQKSSKSFTSQYIYSSENSDPTSLTFNYFYIYRPITDYFVQIVVIGIFVFTILALRVKGAHFSTVKKCFDKQSKGIFLPVIIITSILFLGCAVAVHSIFTQVHNNIYSARCMRRHAQSVILNGDNNSNWAGLLGYKNLLELQANYLQSLYNMSTYYNSPTVTIKNRKDMIAKFSVQFINQYSNASITNPYNEQVVMFRTLIPSLLINTANTSLLSKIKQEHKKMLDISKLAMLIQDIVLNIKPGSGVSSTALNKKIMQFAMMAKAFKKLTLFSQDGEGQFQSQYQQFLLIAAIYIGVGYTTILLYMVLLIISTCKKNHCLSITTNLLWFIILAQFMLGIILGFWFFPISDSLSIECPYFQKLLTNQTYYNQSFYNSTSGVNPHTTFYFASNLYQLMQPCIFSKEQNTNFSSFTQYEYDTLGLHALMKNIQLYMNVTNPSNPQFIDLYSYNKVYSSAIQYIKDQMKGKTQNWLWLKNLLEEINNYTLNNINNDSCYRHRWVFDIGGCGPGQEIYIWPTDNFLLNTGNYQNAKVVCFSLTNDERGNITFITYKQFIKTYMLNINQTRCSATIHTILNLSLLLTDALMLKQQSLQSIVDTLQSQQTILTQYLRVLRKNYSKKRLQFRYILSQGLSKNITAQSYLNYTYSIKQQNNCTIIRYWLNYLFEESCLALRSNVLRVLVGGFFQLICLSAIIFCGCFNGIIQEGYQQFTPVQDKQKKQKKVKSKINDSNNNAIESDNSHTRDKTNQKLRKD